MPDLILHQDPRSGNCYKIVLTAALLGISLAIRNYDIMKGETRTPGFLAGVNANGRIPVLQIGDRFLPESNAACWYLGQGSALVPDDRFAQADVLRWMFFEQYNHEPNIAVARFWLHMLGAAPSQEALAEKQRLGYLALDALEGGLVGQEFLVGGRYSIADIALYAYTHVAGEGGFDLGRYPAIRGWLARVAAQPGHVTIDV